MTAFLTLRRLGPQWEAHVLINTHNHKICCVLSLNYWIGDGMEHQSRFLFSVRAWKCIWREFYVTWVIFIRTLWFLTILTSWLPTTFTSWSGLQHEWPERILVENVIYICVLLLCLKLFLHIILCIVLFYLNVKGYIFCKKKDIKLVIKRQPCEKEVHLLNVHL